MADVVKPPKRPVGQFVAKPPPPPRVSAPDLPSAPDMPSARSLTPCVPELVEDETNLPQLDPPSTSVATATQLAESIVSGVSLGDKKDSVVRASMHQPEKADLLNGVAQEFAATRLTTGMTIVDNAERTLKRMSFRKMSESEAVRLWTVGRTIMSESMEQIRSQRPVDTVAALNKVDFDKKALANNNAKWEGTTPQGREIIRKRLFDLKQSLLEESGLPNETTLDIEPTKG